MTNLLNPKLKVCIGKSQEWVFKFMNMIHVLLDDVMLNRDTENSIMLHMAHVPNLAVEIVDTMHDSTLFQRLCFSD